MADSIYAPQPDAPNGDSSVGSIASSDAAAAPAAPPHPYLTKPVLHVSGIEASLSDKDLASAVFGAFLPVRLHIDRSGEPAQLSSGVVEFQTLQKAEKALATIRGPVQLAIGGDESDPKPTAKPRLVKQLAYGVEDGDVYDLFRPFGALARAQRITTNPAGQHTGFRGMAILEYYNEQDAQTAQNEMHCAEVGGKALSVAIDNVARRPTGQEFSPSAAPFVPGGGSGFRSGSGGMSAAAPAFQPPATARGSGSSIYATATPPPQLNSGPIIPVPGTNLQYSAVAATYIDPCNLFCKNLDPEISSNDLFSAFKDFGRIVSARVMRDAEGVSREFGFVSFTNADDASRALHAMNNQKMGSKTMSVRLHEPKKMREQKLASKFNGSGERGDSPTGGAASETNGSPGGTPQLESNGKRADKRQSNSYFKAAMEKTDALIDADQLSALSPSVRNELVAGEFSRRVRDLPTVRADQVGAIVAELVKLKLPETVEALNNPIELIQRVNDARDVLPQSPRVAPSSLLTTPIVPGGGAGGDGASMMSTAPASSKERERLLKAVNAALPAGSPVEDITDMLASLSKKERALCLFNPDFLRQKVEAARECINDTEGDDEEGVIVSTAGDAATSKASESVSPSQPQQPAHTLASLAKLPAVEIVKLARSTPAAGSSGLPLPKADAATLRETDAFIDGLAGKPGNDQKQKVGDFLFKRVRSFGIKGAPKVTISLLDTEDLRALAHLCNSYPEVLREKVALLVAAQAAK